MANVRGKKNPFPSKPKSSGRVFNEPDLKPSGDRSLLNYATGNGKKAESPHVTATSSKNLNHQKHYGRKY